MYGKKTTAMLAVERRFKAPVEKLVPDLISIYGITRTAEEIGVSRATVGQWFLRIKTPDPPPIVYREARKRPKRTS